MKLNIPEIPQKINLIDFETWNIKLVNQYHKIFSYLNEFTAVNR
jgi:hypothetical protein